jgi:GNAT superfamily N-acetyltransferase
MAAVPTLAGINDLTQVALLLAAFHLEVSLNTSVPHRKAATTKLLDGTPLGALYLIGPRAAPVGHIAISHGLSIEFGGAYSLIDEFFIRPPISSKGLSAESLLTVCKLLEANGTRSVHLEVANANETAHQLYSRCGYSLRTNYHLMNKELN